MTILRHSRYYVPYRFIDYEPICIYIGRDIHIILVCVEKKSHVNMFGTPIRIYTVFHKSFFCSLGNSHNLNRE